MRKLNYKFVILFLSFFVLSIPVSALNAKVTYVKGKVEVSRKGSWIQLKTGDSVSENETISTGYQSEARFDLNGSILSVPAMTRVTIEKIKSGSEKNEVSVCVDTGVARSKVKKVDNKKIDYKTRTAVAVASVRGTDYTQFANGMVFCDEGTVFVCAASDFDFVNNVNAGTTSIGRGQQTKFGESKKPSPVNNRVSKKERYFSNGVKTLSEKEGDDSFNLGKNPEKCGKLIITVTN